MSDIKEKLIAKLQLEYATGMVPANRIFTHYFDYNGYTWDLGLLYITNKNLWFVNTAKEKTKIPYHDLVYITDIIQSEGKKTKFTDLLKATHVLSSVYRPEGFEGKISFNAGVIMLSGPQNVLNALRTQVRVRASSQFEMAYELWINRKISTLMYLGIRDEDKLSYFLNVPVNELLNIILKRNSYFK